MKIVLLIHLLTTCTTIAHSQGMEEYITTAIPDSITDKASRIDYVITHYWDRFPFADTTLLRPDVGEQATVNYLALLPYASETARKQGIALWMERTATNSHAMHYFFNTAEHYLYHPDSPMKNEATFRLVLMQVRNSASEEIRQKAEYYLTLTARNNPGEKASDFQMRILNQPADRLFSLSSLLSEMPTLLLFYDPNCEKCQQLLLLLRNSSVINEAITKKRLRVIAVDTESDAGQWQQTAEKSPTQWIRATDFGYIQAHGTYDLRAMPVMYLIDAEGKVILKDADSYQLTTFIQR